jgi:hypothetical protein
MLSSRLLSAASGRLLFFGGGWLPGGHSIVRDGKSAVNDRVRYRRGRPQPLLGATSRDIEGTGEVRELFARHFRPASPGAPAPPPP